MFVYQCASFNTIAQQVGIGTQTPGQTLDINGWLRLGNESASAPPNTNDAGSIRYNTSSLTVEVNTDGTIAGWTALGPKSNAVVSGSIWMWSGSFASIPSGWVLCDGNNSTPDLRNKFIMGAATTAAVGAGGSNGITLTSATMPAHTHSITTDATAPTLSFSGTQQNITPTAGFTGTAVTINPTATFTGTAATIPFTGLFSGTTTSIAPPTKSFTGTAATISPSANLTGTNATINFTGNTFTGTAATLSPGSPTFTGTATTITLAGATFTGSALGTHSHGLSLSLAGRSTADCVRDGGCSGDQFLGIYGNQAVTLGTVSETPAGTVSVVAFNYTPAGSVTATSTASYTPAGSYTLNGGGLSYTPAGAVNSTSTASFTPSGTVTISGSYTPAGTISYATNGLSYTPQGTLSVSSVSHTPAGTVSPSASAYTAAGSLAGFSHTHTYTTDASGNASPSSFNNIPSYFRLAYIMKQ